MIYGVILFATEKCAPVNFNWLVFAVRSRIVKALFRPPHVQEKKVGCFTDALISGFEQSALLFRPSRLSQWTHIWVYCPDAVLNNLLGFEALTMEGFFQSLLKYIIFNLHQDNSYITDAVASPVSISFTNFTGKCRDALVTVAGLWSTVIRIWPFPTPPLSIAIPAATLVNLPLNSSGTKPLYLDIYQSNLFCSETFA